MKMRLALAPAMMAVTGLAVLVGVQAGCRHLGKLSDAAATAAEAAGKVSPEEAEAMRRSGAAVGRAFEQLTPEQEYYIGRAVGASLLARYPVWDNEAATQYVNLLGRAVAMASAMPETFGGYRFLILDSDEINAFAAPGGLILVTRGMLRLCRTEDALAAVLAHEIGHVQHRHGLQAIRRGRLTGALTILAAEAGRHLGGEDLAELTRAFEGSVSDIIHTVATSGYARSAEREADRAALDMLVALGYSPGALVEMLQEMDRRIVPGRPDFARTHPPPAQRIGEIRRMLRGRVPEVAPHPERAQRFARAMRGV